MVSSLRYYLNQFRDAYRHAAIDLLTGHSVSDDLIVANAAELSEGDEASKKQAYLEEDTGATAEHVKVLIEDCKKLLIPDLESVVGSWGMINNDPLTGDSRQEDMDVIFILARDSYYVAHYDDEADKVTHYQRVLLCNVDRVELGLPESGFNLTFGRSQVLFVYQNLSIRHSILNYSLFRPSSVQNCRSIFSQSRNFKPIFV